MTHKIRFHRNNTRSHVDAAVHEVNRIYKLLHRKTSKTKKLSQQLTNNKHFVSRVNKADRLPLSHDN